MHESSANIYEQFAPLYLKRGLTPLPIEPGSKVCRLRGWSKLDLTTDPTAFRKLRARYPAYGIGISMGTNLPDGTKLGAVDIDHDDFVEIGRVVLRQPICGRVGKKGAAIFVRFRGSAPKELKTRSGVKVADLLFERKLCVLPPTIHPETNRPYTWIGRPLHDVEFDQLPLIEV